MNNNFEFYYNKKIFKIFLFFILFILIIIIRLFYLQIFQKDTFYSKGERNFLRMEILESPRGNVLDCNGHLLATNGPLLDLYWEGNSFLDFDEELAHKILSILKINETKLLDLRIAERFSRRVIVKENLSFEELCRISEQCSHAAKLVVVNHFKRTYPYNNLASHVLGYLGRPEKRKMVGCYGLEKILQETLEGEKGYVLHVINSTGKRLEQRESKQAKSGENITLTLDRDMQLIADSLFDENQAGVFIVMDPEDGAIKTLASYPNFNPNFFVEDVLEKDFEELSSKRSPFLNRAISALYPPASVFKLITYTAGLSEGIISTNSEFYCGGFTTFGERKYNCLKHTGHGILACRDAIAYSCNIPCYDIAKQISIDKVADYAARFGLGIKTGFMIEDKNGLVPSSVWKRQVKHERWHRGETLSVCIGQGSLLVTPMQIARMISSIYTGYLVKPRILLEEPIEKKPLQVSGHFLTFLKSAMKSAIEIGSARRLKTLKNFSIYAKTGTAQTASLKMEQLEHGWFTCYFSYKNQKPLVIVCLLEQVGTALPPLLMTKRFLQAYASLRSENEK